MKKIKSRMFSLIELLVVVAMIALMAALLVPRCQAQTVVQGVSISGTLFQYGGQSFLITTNQSGGLVVETFGVQGTNIVTVPVSADQAMQVGLAWLQQNNPANIGYYNPTNETDARLFAGYLQNSGSAIAGLSVSHYGWIAPNLGFEAGVLQGNKSGQSGTAGEYGGIDYRKPIGDVAAHGGIDVGYDQWNNAPFFAPRVGLEYRQNQHLGEFVDVAYAIELRQKSAVVQDNGLVIFAGVTYAF